VIDLVTASPVGHFVAHGIAHLQDIDDFKILHDLYETYDALDCYKEDIEDVIGTLKDQFKEIAGTPHPKKDADHHKAHHIHAKPVEKPPTV
jgi:hypothetical protein